MDSDVVLSMSFFKLDLRIVRGVSGARHFYVHVKMALLRFISGNNREAGRPSFAVDWAKSLNLNIATYSFLHRYLSLSPLDSPIVRFSSIFFSSVFFSLASQQTKMTDNLFV